MYKTCIYYNVINRLLPNTLIRGILLERIPNNLRDKSILLDLFKQNGLSITSDRLHIMRNRLGRTMGRGILLLEDDVLSKDKIDLIDKILPLCKLTYCDNHGIRMFVEQCYRFIYLSDDLQRLGNPENLHRVVTITPVPRSYGCSELSEIISQNTGILIDPKNVIFRFTKSGNQDSTAWVIADTVRDANHIISKFQEIPIPDYYQYQSLLGTSFLYASRSNLFLSHESLDLIPLKSKYQIVIFGWHEDVGEDEIEHLLRSLKFYPKKVTKIPITLPSATNGFDSMVVIEFDRMRNAKVAMSRLQMLKRRWKISPISNFFAYPKLADIHWEDDDEYSDEQDDDSDLDEPIDY